MTYGGVVKNGVVVVEDANDLSDGTVVRIEPIPFDEAHCPPGVYGRWEAFAGPACELETDP
jgi:hypothetical protein